VGDECRGDEMTARAGNAKVRDAIVADYYIPANAHALVGTRVAGRTNMQKPVGLRRTSLLRATSTSERCVIDGREALAFFRRSERPKAVDGH
jgi:hypothetical protein